MYALIYAHPENNGLPIFSTAGNTFIWEYTPVQQNGFYSTWWMANLASEWTSVTWSCYYGATPYPPGGSGSPDQLWSIPGLGLAVDNVTTRAAGTYPVVKGVKYTQGFRVIGGTGQNKHGIFYPNLPSVIDSHVIDFTSTSSTYGDTLPPDLHFIMFESPWAKGVERSAGDHGRWKIYPTQLSEAQMLAEAADMSRNVSGSPIWWGKNDWRSADDLTSDYPNGVTLSWYDTNYKATRIAI